jgi:serine/threonine-protein kinase
VSFLPELVRGGPVLLLDAADELRVRACLNPAAAPEGTGVDAISIPTCPAAGPMRVTLTVTAGPHAGREFTFARHDTFLVGRSAQAHFQLASKDRYFSRLHFLVEVNPPRCALLDLGSRNGTHVNGRKVTSCRLQNGDEIRAGHTTLRVGIRGAPAVPPPPAVTLPAPSPLAAPPAVTILSPLACQNCGASEAAPLEPGGFRLCAPCLEAADRQPQPVAGYRLFRELGRGGMGVVHLALRVADGRPAAVKMIQPSAADDPAAVQRFLRETDILRQLDHPHIVAWREVGESAGLLWFAMDYVPGRDAETLLKREGPLAVGRAVALIRQALDGLGYAHDRGFVHRDVKPSNLLIAGAKGEEVLRLADFGLARLYQASQLSGLTLAGDVGGTPAFMPPEQITAYRDACPASDQYSAAATLYNLLTDAHVHDFGGKDMAKNFLAILHEDAVPLRSRRPDLPEELALVVHRALDRGPTRRWPDVRAFAAALAPFADSPDPAGLCG